MGLEYWIEVIDLLIIALIVMAVIIQSERVTRLKGKVSDLEKEIAEMKEHIVELAESNNDDMENIAEYNVDVIRALEKFINRSGKRTEAEVEVEKEEKVEVEHHPV